MRRTCAVIIGIYGALCLVALILVPLSAAGALGVEPDPLSGVFALLLSLPWSYMLNHLASETSVGWNLALAAVGMLANAAVLAVVCGHLARRRASARTAAPR